jgi:osmotically-inducible protein OsmY
MAASPAPAARDAGKFKDVEVREDPVRTGIEAGDAGLAAQVRARLAGDPQLRQQHIEVDAEGGRVTLWGQATRAEDRTAAEQLARRTPGVAGVNDLIKVASPTTEPR